MLQDCPAGSYESRACAPPNVRQICTPCLQCPRGFYIRTPCSAKNDTVCERCTSSVCTDDRYNAQFGALGGCQVGPHLAICLTLDWRRHDA